MSRSPDIMLLLREIYELGALLIYFRNLSAAGDQSYLPSVVQIERGVSSFFLHGLFFLSTSSSHHSYQGFSLNFAMALPTAKPAAVPDSQASSFLDTTIATTDRRAQAPSLSFDNLKPFQSNLGSNASTPSSRYLSPPVSVTDRSSPPPHREAEDYITSGDRHARKRKQHTTRERRSHSHMTNRKGSAATESSVTTKTPATQSEAVNISSNAHTVGNNNSIPETNTQPRKKSRAWWQDFGSNDVLPRGHQSSLVPTARQDEEDFNVSLAANSLRRFSCCAPQTTTTNFIDIRRLSHAVTSTLSAVFTSKDDDSAINTADENAGFPVLTSHHINDFSNSTGDHGSSASTEDRLHVKRATPATITLRKASQPSNVSPVVEPPLLPITLTSNLLAFSSIRVPQKSPSISEKSFSFSDQNEDIGPQLDPATRSMSLANRRKSSGIIKPPSTRARSGTLPSSTSTDQGHSLLSDIALTKTGIYPGFGSFINPCSKFNGSPAMPSIRTSIVHVVSRTSLHEIIWRETETSSSGSGSSFGTVKQTDRPHSSSQSPIDNTLKLVGASQPPQRKLEVSTKSNSRPPSPFDIQEPLTHTQQEAQKALFAWSWDGSRWENSASPASAHNTKNGVPTTSQSPHLTKSSTFSEGTVFPTPSTGDHRSTFDWLNQARKNHENPFVGRSEAKITRAATGGLETGGKKSQNRH